MKHIKLLLIITFIASNAYGFKEAAIYSMHKKKKFHPKPMTYKDRNRRDVVAVNINPYTLYKLGMEEYKRSGNLNNKYLVALRKAIYERQSVLNLKPINSK